MSNSGETKFKESVSSAQKILKGKKENFARLQREVINTGACVSCGACVASCDVLAFEEGKPKLVGKCTVCGVCYNQCPRTSTTSSELIGDYIAAYTGKSKLEKVKGQDGGVATSLLLYALDNKLVDSAIVTCRDREHPWKPVAKIATSGEEVLPCSGSIYCHSQVIPMLTKALKNGCRSIAFVGTPCKIDAAYKMQNSHVGLVHLFKDADVLRIGLFCMDSFSYNGLSKFLKEKNGIALTDIVKMNIKEGKFRVTLSKGEEKEFPIADMDSIRSSSCDFCPDLTSEAADVSVGSIGSQPGFSTIIVRTDKGMDMINNAAKHDYLEFKPLSEEDMQKVLNLSRVKKNQRYAPREKPRYILESPPVTLEAFSVSEAQSGKTPMKFGEAQLLADEKAKMRVTIRNDSIDCLGELKVRIAHKGGAQDGFVGWEIPICEWLPSQVVEFEYPRIDGDSEYIIDIESNTGGKLLTKKVSIAELTKK